MKHVKKRYMARLIFITLIGLSLHNSANSQPWPNDPWSNGSGGAGQSGFTTEDGTDPPPDDPGDPDPDLPIDSNILVLVAVVVCYGLKKTWDVKRNSKRNNLASTANFEDFIQ